MESKHEHEERTYCDGTPTDKDDGHSGIAYFFTAEYQRLQYASVWIDAIVFGRQRFSFTSLILVLFSLSLGDGGLMKIASHNQFTNNILQEAIIVCGLDFIMNLFSGIIFFNSVGIIACEFFNC